MDDSLVQSPLARRSYRVSIAEQPPNPSACHAAIFILIALFAINGSLGNNAFWVQLPFLVPTVKDGASLTNNFILLTEAANGAAIVYLLLQRFIKRWDRPLGEVAFIYMTFICSIASLVPSAFLQWTALDMNENTTSIVLYICYSFTALLHCISPITYIPFAGKIRPAYIAAVLLGNAWSSLLPHVLSFVQGIGKHPSCMYQLAENSSKQTRHPYYVRISTTPLPPLPPEVRFDPIFYYLSLASICLLSGLCFFLLHHSCARLRDADTAVERGEESASLAVGQDDDAFHSAATGYDNVLDDGTIRASPERTNVASSSSAAAQHYMAGYQGSTSHQDIMDKHYIRVHRMSGGSFGSRGSWQQRFGFRRPRSSSGSSKLSQSLRSKHASTYPILMLITIWLVAVVEGPLSSIKAHACYPTENGHFLLGSLAACITRSCACLFALRLNPNTRVTIIIAMTSLGTITLTYFAALVGFSYGMDSLIFGSTGQFLGTMAWVTGEFLFSLSMAGIGIISAEVGGGYLFCYSTFYLIGQALGTLVMAKHFSVCRIYPPHAQNCLATTPSANSFYY